MISLVVTLDLCQRVQRFAIGPESWIGETVATRRETHWFTTSRGDLEKRCVCICVSGGVPVCRRYEDDCVAFGRPNGIELFAGVGDATSETTFDSTAGTIEFHAASSGSVTHLVLSAAEGDARYDRVR